LRISFSQKPWPRQSAIRNELQAVKQWYHLEKDILKHSQIKMSVTASVEGFDPVDHAVVVEHFAAAGSSGGAEF
jgi:hypothetical protein